MFLTNHVHIIVDNFRIPPVPYNNVALLSVSMGGSQDMSGYSCYRRQNVLSNFYIIILSFMFYLIKNHKKE